MNLIAALFLVFLIGVCSATEVKKPLVVGVAATECVRSIIHGLEPGTPVTLLDSTGKGNYSGILVKPIERCGGTESGEPGYLLLTTGKFDLALAVLGVVPSGATVSSCASSENVHLFLFTAGPRQLLAHDSWYLGYNVEPDCTPEDEANIQSSP